MDMKRLGRIAAMLALIPAIAQAMAHGAPYFVFSLIFVAYFAAMALLAKPYVRIEKDTDLASVISRIPGLGHYYLRMKRRAMLFFSMGALTVTSLTLCAATEDVLLLISNFVAMLFGLMFMSGVDVEVMIENVFEGGARGRFRLAYFSVTATGYLFMMVAIAGIVCAGGMVNPWQYAAVGGIWTVAMAFATHRYLRTRHLDPPKGWMTAPGKD
ncbi:MAG: hypothetical protein LBG62_02350 [Candidatus Methanoplasma sp.]|jgi:hypothetical protein|nr:hypothetical protein [Candidatus Methanoplasma sp.]